MGAVGLERVLVCDEGNRESSEATPMRRTFLISCFMAVADGLETRFFEVLYVKVIRWSAIEMAMWLVISDHQMLQFLISEKNTVRLW